MSRTLLIRFTHNITLVPRYAGAILWPKLTAHFLVEWRFKRDYRFCVVFKELGNDICLSVCLAGWLAGCLFKERGYIDNLEIQ